MAMAERGSCFVWREEGHFVFDGATVAGTGVDCHFGGGFDIVNTFYKQNGNSLERNGHKQYWNNIYSNTPLLLPPSSHLQITLVVEVEILGPWLAT
jgi:hypothetical protein